MIKSWQNNGLMGLTVAIIFALFLGTVDGTEVGEHIVPEMVLIHSGVFQMGDEVGDLWNECIPVHDVTLTYDYWVGKYQVTFDEYDAFCDATNRPRVYDYGWGRNTRPIINVSWRDAITFCNWLSEQEGLKPAYNIKEQKLLDVNGKITTDITQVEGFRLLTEAEWEYAASGGHEVTQTEPRFLYSGSNDIEEVAWYSNNSGELKVNETRVDFSKHGAALIEGKSSQPVGQKKPNALGLYDMSGNVWEWCHDYYGLYTEDSQVNPVGALTGHVRVMRGGSWIFGANDCRVACRLYRPPHDTLYRIGFRIARSVL